MTRRYPAPPPSESSFPRTRESSAFYDVQNLDSRLRGNDAVAELLAHYERIADATDAINRLRGFVLDLAVRGKLVPQFTGDEPAAELLQRVAQEKVRRVKAGEVRKPKALPTPDDPPCDLPENWQWSCIAEIGFIGPRVEAEDDEFASFVPMPLIAAEVGVAHQHEKRQWGEIKKGYTHFAEGDVGLAKITPCFENGKSAVFRNLTGGFGSGTTELHVVRPVLIVPDYVLLFFKSSNFIETGIPRMTGTAGQKRVPADYFAYSPFPLPPLAEQHRIVAKVDELMALCDRLEAARAQREATRDRLTASTLARLNTPEPPASPDGDAPKESSFQSDARFALKVLPALTTRPDQIKQLRQTILSLAVRGNLVRQIPHDEPASQLLKRIELKRNALLEAAYPSADESRAQLLKQSGQAIPSGLPVLPAGWVWATLMQCSAMVIDCRNKTAPQVPSGVRLVRTTNIRGGQFNNLDPRYVDEATYEIWSSRGHPQPGDILITREAPMGEVCLIPPGAKLCLGQRVMLARLVPDTIDAKFMIYSLRDPLLMERVQDKPIGATVPHLRVGGVETLLVPLPPHQEQARIVQKLDELMSLCDQLKASLTRGENTRSRLLNALLHEAFAPQALAA